MITKKQPANQERIVLWMLKNSYAYSISNKATNQQSSKKIQRALKYFKSYLASKFNDGSHAIKVPKLGVLFKQQILSGNKAFQDKLIYKIKPSPQLLLSFSLLSSQNSLNLKQAQEIDYAQVAGIAFLEKQFVKHTIQSYIIACIQLAKLQPDRKYKLNLGVLILQFYQKKITIKQAPIEKQNNTFENRYNSFFSSKMYANNKLSQKTWQDSIQGTIGNYLNLREIKNNLDQGSVVTSKYHSLVNNQYL